MTLLILVFRMLGILLGITLIGVGVPLFFLPIPLGIFSIALGILVLMISSASFAAWVRRRRARNPKFNRRLEKIEAGLPRLLAGILAASRPDRA